MVTLIKKTSLMELDDLPFIPLHGPIFYSYCPLPKKQLIISFHKTTPENVYVET
jgi:hypothetical protein